jgi:hypothetical protein
MLGRCSFIPDTKVLLADGFTKRIKDIDVGDVVVATDPAEGETTGKPVTRLYDNLDTELADVTVVDQEGVKSILHTTQNHPFGMPPGPPGRRRPPFDPATASPRPPARPRSPGLVHSEARGTC